MAKRYSYSFARQKESEEGITSTILAVVSILVFTVAAVLSFMSRGEGGMLIGFIGLVGMCISVYGFGLGLKSFSVKERNYKYSKIGSIANGIIMIGWLTLFLLGVS